jgi:Bacterial regulatory helix-turn-helix protein, lysR family
MVKSNNEIRPIYADDLCLFAEVACRGTYAAVARDRACDASAVSKSIIELETVVGFGLFQRATRPLALTASGERFLGHVVSLLQEVNWGRGLVSFIQIGPLAQFSEPGKRVDLAPTMALIANHLKRWYPEPSLMTKAKTSGKTSKTAVLPDGEFFVIRDERPLRSETFSTRKMFDPDPQETENIKARRKAYAAKVEPDYNSTHCDIFHRPYPLPPSMTVNLVHKQYGISRPVPKNGLEHEIYLIPDYASKHYYDVVSPEWKLAIETVDPGRHEFFDFKIVFSDATIQRFICRIRQNILFLPESTNSNCYPSDLVGNLSALAGCHLFQCGGWPWIFVSRELAQLLLPLMPRYTSFAPIASVN